MAGVTLEDKEGAEQNRNAAPFNVSPGRGNRCWWPRVNICPGSPETEWPPGL